MLTQSTRRTFVGGAIVAAGALGSLALFGGADGESLASGILPSRDAFAPISAQAQTSAEIQRWAAAIGAPVRLSSPAGGTTGRIHQVLSAVPSKVPAGVREQQFIVYLEIDKVATALTDRIYDITAPIEGLRQVYLGVAEDRGAKAMMLAVFA